MGGGGGNEIENKIEVFQIESAQQKILKKVVHEEATDKECPNFFDLGGGGLNIMAACVTS